jgi:hypothetical protein
MMHISQMTAQKVKMRMRVWVRKKIKIRTPNRRRNQTSQDNTPLQLCDKLQVLPFHHQRPQIPNGRKGLQGIIIFSRNDLIQISE